jgi:hypothetical protein
VLDKAEAAFGKLLSDLDSGLGSIVDAFKGLIDAVQPLADLIHRVLNPILKIVGTLLGGIGTTLQLLIAILDPVLSLLSDALNGIAGLLKTIFEPLKSTMNVLVPIVKLLGDLGKVLVPLAPIFTIIGVVLKFVALVLMGIMFGIGSIINAIAKAFGATKDVVDTTSIGKQMETIALSMGDGFQGVATTIDDGSKKMGESFEQAAARIANERRGLQAGSMEDYEAWLRQNGYQKPISEEEWKASQLKAGWSQDQVDQRWLEHQKANPIDTSYQGYLESLEGYVKPQLQDLSKSVDDASKHFEKLNEQLTNVPQGFKANRRRFEAAAAAVDAPASARGKVGDVHVHVTGGITTTIKTVTDLVEEQLRKRGFQRDGTPVPA